MTLEDFPTDLQGNYVEHQHLLSSDRAGWEKLELVYELEPAGEMPGTVAQAHCLIVCLGEFQGSFLIDGQWHHEQYRYGDIAMVAAGELFPRVKVDREVPLLELFLSPDSLINGIGEVMRPKLQLQSSWRLRDPLIQQVAWALKTELEQAGSDSKSYAEAMATALGAHLLQRYGVRDGVVKEYRGGLTPYQLKVVVDYIQANLDQDLTLSVLASLLEISPHYFAGLFKQSTGLSPHKYITQCRLEMAKTLLGQSELPISMVGLEVGYKNQSHFTRVFRQHFGITPKAFQNFS